ncbi:MAG: carboxylating nicotinate-nucleotide diphosphorylase [Acidobacteria bacterium]|nr:carboxylating nicotinate-nucleotide diphosphorylase [Acidobacteriota bacterium]
MAFPIPNLPPLPRLLYEDTVRKALLEDLGRAGDLTTDAIVPPGTLATGCIVARAPGRIAGLDVAICAFLQLNREFQTEALVADGHDAAAGAVLAKTRGPARALLTAERTALNFLGRLSGIATATRDMVAAISAYPSQVVCTRKTTPGLRTLEKYAVRAGGGANHRFGLDDAVLIKDNHRVLAGNLTEAVRRVRASIGHLVKIEAEVDTLEQLEEALRLEIDAVLLDNMSLEHLAQAVRMAAGKVITEASGNIAPATAAAVAATGVDLISVGWLTHSAPGLDVALDVAL